MSACRSARTCYTEALKYVSKRKVFGKLLIQNAVVQPVPVLDTQTHIYASKSLDTRLRTDCVYANSMGMRRTENGPELVYIEVPSTAICAFGIDSQFTARACAVVV